jgi:hypothetical protein
MCACGMDWTGEVISGFRLFEYSSKLQHKDDHYYVQEVVVSGYKGKNSRKL